MTPSLACEKLIQSFEGCRLRAYLPTPNDVPTIGWGSTGPDIVIGLQWTQSKADERFRDDLARFAIGVSAAIGGAPTTQAQFDAMTCLAYNIGITNFTNSTLLRKHIAGDYAGADEQFARWNKQAGQVLNGLTRRRAAEADMYRGTS